MATSPLAMEETEFATPPKGKEEHKRVADVQTEAVEQTSTKEVSGNEDSIEMQSPIETQPVLESLDSAITKAEPGDSLKQETASSSLPLPLVREKNFLNCSKDTCIYCTCISHLVMSTPPQSLCWTFGLSPSLPVHNVSHENKKVTVWLDFRETGFQNSSPLQQSTVYMYTTNILYMYMTCIHVIQCTCIHVALITVEFE